MHTYTNTDLDDKVVNGAAPLACQGTTRARILGERFQLTDKIGRGAMGAVYRAIDLIDECECAVKLLSPSSPTTAETYQRFVREATIVAGLFHPHIVDIRHFGRDADGTPFLVMELLQGQDLFQLTRGNRRLPLAYGLDVLNQAGCAIQAMHSMGVIHRDIKLQNIFLCHDKSHSGRAGGIVKLVDFGLSTMLGAEQLTGAGTVVGTMEYLSPEGTYGNSQALDTYSDQWSLAVVAYRLLSGYMPFEADNIISLIVEIRQARPLPLRERMPGLPQHVCDAIHRALSPRKQDRHESIEVLISELLHGSQPSRRKSLAHSDSAPAASGALPRGLETPTIMASVPQTIPPPTPPAPASTGGLLRRRILLAGLMLLSLAAFSYGLLLGLRKGQPGWRLVRSPPPRTTPYLAGGEPPPADPATGMRPAPVPLAKVEAPRTRELPPPQRLLLPAKRHHAGSHSSNSVPTKRAEETERAPLPAHPPAVEAAPRRPQDPPALPETHGPLGPLPSPAQVDKVNVQTALSPPPAQPAVAALPPGRRNLQSCGEPPRLPDEVKRLRRGSTLSSQYLLCVNEQGAVQTAKVVHGIDGADDFILSALRRWRCPPWPIPTCSIVSFDFVIE